MSLLFVPQSINSSFFKILFFIIVITHRGIFPEWSWCPRVKGREKPPSQPCPDSPPARGAADGGKAEKGAIRVGFGIDTDLGLPSHIVLPSAQTWTLPLKFGFSINVSSWGENSVICLISLLPLLWHINIKNICGRIKDLPKHFSFYFT